MESQQVSVVDAAAVAEACASRKVAFFSAETVLGRNVPPGTQTARTRVTQGTLSLEATLHLYVLPITGLEIDLAAVDWGVVGRGSAKTVEGDYDFTHDGKRPTLRNLGNVDANVSLSFARMINAKGEGAIECFSAALNGEPSGTLEAGQVVCFAGALAPDELGRLDLSVHPGAIAPGIYQATLQLWAGFGCGGSSATPTPLSTPTPQVGALPTAEPTPNATGTPPATATFTPTATPTSPASTAGTPTATVTPVPSATAAGTPTPEATDTPHLTPSTSATAVATPELTPTPIPPPATASPSATPTGAATPAATSTPDRPTATPAPGPSITPTPESPP
jgi:hypothetical protein